MKKIAMFLGVLVLLISCKDSAVEKPDRLIDEETMGNIIYDLSVLEAMKAKNPTLTGSSTSEYVYKKYKVDSVQFQQSNKYYASEIAKYKSIYDKVNGRMDSEQKLADSIAKKKGEKVSTPPASGNTPQIK